MSSPSYIEVAYFVKTFGLKGELKTVLLDNIDLDFSNLDTIFLEDRGQKIPYFIESVKSKNGEIIIKIEDIDTPEMARKLCKKQIYIDNTTSDLNMNVKDNPTMLKGYSAYHQKELLGKIDRLESYPLQIMAIIKQNEKEVMIPLVDEFIEYIEPDGQEIHFILPDGFLDL